MSYNSVNTRLGFKRSMLESLSNMYYRMYYCHIIVLGVYQLQAKLQYSLTLKQYADILVVLTRLVSSKLTPWRQRIGTQRRTVFLRATAQQGKSAKKI